MSIVGHAGSGGNAGVRLSGFIDGVIINSIGLGYGNNTSGGKAATMKTSPAKDEVFFSTRRLKRNLHSRLHILKAARNAHGKLRWTLDMVLNDALAAGLVVLERQVK